MSVILPEDLFHGQEVEARFSRRDTEDGTAPDWSEWETVTLYLRRREKDLSKKYKYSRNSKEGDIIELTVQERDWAGYGQSDYSPEHDLWLAEEYRMQIRVKEINTNVKLHKVTVFVIDCGFGDEMDGLAQLQGDMAHNSGSRIVEIQTAEFDREWSDDDPLNKTTTMDDRALLESMMESKPKISLIF